MSNEKKVREYFITPMLRFYGGALSQFQVEAFISDLGRYSEAQLSAAWQEVRRTAKTRPNIAHFVEAIQKATPSAPSGQPIGPGAYAWEKRDREAAKLAAEYVQRFDCSPLMQTATAEGWAKRLRGYVAEVASLQAQIIAGALNAGVTAAAVRYGETTAEAAKFRLKRLVQECREQAGRGFIEVAVPAEAIAHWKRTWGRRRERQGVPGVYPAPAILHLGALQRTRERGGEEPGLSR